MVKVVKTSLRRFDKLSRYIYLHEPNFLDYNLFNTLFISDIQFTNH